jgi:VCBS repeat-containing protein
MVDETAPSVELHADFEDPCLEITCIPPPIAIDDAATTDENNSVNIDVTANDIAIDGAINKTTVTITRDPQDGSLGVNSSTGVVSYTPDPGFCGSDYFMYTVDDNYGMTSNEATVTVTVVCNESPQAGDDGATTDENTSVGIDVPANDTDSDGTIDRTTVTITKNPEDGSVSVHPTSGVVTYTPNLGSCGSDTFKYTVDDNDGATSNEAMVTVNVLCNDPPLAIDDLYSMSEGGTLDIPVPGILANDVDTPGSLLTAILISNAEHGTLSLNTDGSFTYIHDGSETSGDSFTYKANDGAKDSNAASVSIVINPTNDPPMARDDDAATDEDVPVIIDVLTNDSDPDGDTLSVDWVSQPANGTASNNGSDVTYTPGPDFYGTDTFTYTASDGNGGTATAMVTVFVATVNDPPLAQDDSDATDEDVPVIIDVLMNDSDPDGDALSVDWVTQPPNGTASNNGSDVTYTPDPAFNGVDTFTYAASDGNGGTATATVTVAVAMVNDPPVAQDDSAATNEDTPVTIRVLANDTDPDGDSLVIESSTQPLHGATARSGTNIIYTPAPNFNGADTFTYTIADGNGGTATATVTVAVMTVNDPPLAQDDSHTTDEDTPVTIPVLANDSDPDGDSLVVESVTQPVNGTVSNNSSNVTYTADAGFGGIDTFSYTVADGKGGTSTARVVVAVSIVNDPPVAQDDSAATNEDTLVTIPLLANDSDPDGDFLLVESFTQPAHGSVLNTRNAVSYIPDAGFNGIDKFSYTVSDGNGGTATATVTVSVAAVNDLPVAQDDSDITDEGTPVIIPVLLNDSDPDGDTLVVESVMQSENGTVSNDGTDVTYTPEAGFSGIDIFDYTISDGKGGTDTATIIVAVASVNDPPVAQNDSAAADKDTPVTISVLANDSDPDADPLRVESVTQPANGTLANNGFDLLYTPDEGFTGSDTFTYTVSDGRGSTDTATVTVGVSGEVGGGGAEDEVPCDGKVIISEVAWAGTASDPRDEWIELRNLGPTPVDLSGWVLRWLRTHPSTADDQIWKVVELSGILLPAAVSAFDQALQDTTPAVRFLKENPEDISWLVLSELDETDDGYYIVERRHDDTVSDVAADLLYDTSQSLSLELSDLGEVIMLMNNLGEVVDTANASYLGRNGWAAGSATTYSTMERVDPLGADVANNWHTNMGIAIHGVDARKRSLRATPRGPNSPVLEDLYLNADIELTTVRSGEVLTVDFLLPKQDRRMAGWPWISVARPGFAGLAGAGGAADQASYSFSGRSEGGDHYVLDIGTKNLPPGEYVFWVIYGQGKAILVPIVVTP